MSRKPKILLVAIILLACIYPSVAQVRFQKTIGGSSTDLGTSIQNTDDGGYIVGGASGSFGQGGIYVIKLDSIGDILWTKSYGGTGADNVHRIQQCMEGGYIMIGETTSFGSGESDIYAIRIDDNGNILWDRTYGGSLGESGNWIKQTSDSGYIVTGGTNSYGVGLSDVYVLRIDQNGDMIWGKVFGIADSMSTEVASGVETTDDGGFIIVGSTFIFGGGEGSLAYTLKIDVSGDTVWTKALGGNDNDGGYRILRSGSNKYMMLGSTSGSGNSGVYLVEMDDSGDTLWTRVYSDSAGLVVRSMANCMDGGYIIAGAVSGIGSNQWDAFLLRVDSMGNILWSQQYDNDVWDEAYSVQQTPDGGFILAGFTGGFTQSSRDVYVIKTDANGNTGCGNEKSIAVTVGNTNTIVSSTNTVVGSGGTSGSTSTVVSSTNTTDSTLCFDTITGLEEHVNPQSRSMGLRAYPNPFTNKTTLTFELPGNITHAELTLTGLSGRTEKSYALQAPYSPIVIHDDGLAAGFYLARIVTGKKTVASAKLIVLP